MGNYEDVLKKEAEHNVKLAKLRLRDQQNHMRPSSHYDVCVRWSPTLGAYVAARENVAAKGGTPEIAMDNFDRLWQTGEGLVDLPDDFEEEDFD